MTVPAPALDEEARLAALDACGILDTLPESAFEDLVDLAQRICETPGAAISFLDSQRQWVKASRGMEGATDLRRQEAICDQTIQGRDLLEVPDATKDERFRNLPIVARRDGVRFYAGVPLVTREGAAVGTLCVFDRAPRSLTSAQRANLEILARQIGAQLELRRQKVALEEALAERDGTARRLHLVYALQRCVHDAHDLPEAMAGSVARLGEALDFQAGGVWLTPTEGGALVNSGGYWVASATFAPFRDATLSTSFSRDIGLPGLVWRTGSPAWLEDLVGEPSIPRLTAALASGLTSGVGFPIFVDGKMVAAVELVSTRRRARDADSLALLAHAAAELGGLIRHRMRDDAMRDLQTRLSAR